MKAKSAIILILSSPVELQAWMSALRLLVGTYMVVYTSISPGVGLNGLWLVIWNLIFANDMFILIFDLIQTNTILGCAATQAALNLAFISLIIISTALTKLSSFHLCSWALPPSLCLLGISLCPFIILKSRLSMEQICRLNTKDAIQVGTSPLRMVRPDLSMFGCPRDSPIRSPVSTGVQRFLVNVLFRRVRPVETRAYALTRHSFAIIAFGILLFRTITALLQVENEFNTRMVSAPCDNRASERHDIGLLMEGPTYPGTNRSVAEISTSITASYVNTTTYQSSTECNVTWSQTFNSSSLTRAVENRTLDMYSCSQPVFVGTIRDQLFTESTEMLVYHIRVRSAVLGSGSQILDSDIPRVWLLNLNEHSSGTSSEVRAYLSPFKLDRGSHTEAQARLATRRFITSSIMKDVILNYEPVSGKLPTPINMGE
ncbi:hypothetical protein B0J17DRAFT_661795 [Rhizoctonia solani]|nr:hypothetical protein B0J17DRAFT_661795 [Rhizoctonia solani]